MKDNDTEHADRTCINVGAVRIKIQIKQEF